MRDSGGMRSRVFALSAVLAFAASAADEPLTYRSAEVNCRWLAVEYETIKRRAAAPAEESPSITGKGVLLSFGMILSLPGAIFNSAFGDDKQKIAFSRDPDDLAAAAREKDCADVLATIAADKRAGKYPSAPSQP